MLVNTESGGGIKYNFEGQQLEQMNSSFMGPGVVPMPPYFRIASKTPRAIKESRAQQIQSTHFKDKDIWEELY